MNALLRCVLPAAALLLAGCGRSGGDVASPSTAAPPKFVERDVPTPSDPMLALGQQVYRGDCYNCHDLGKKGAPRLADGAAWSPRLAQGTDILIRHAIEGYYGPAGDEMPARGGNDALTDADVAAAVRYMISHVL